jgi:transcriptional regulator with XRE-family HTH domain
MGAMYLWNQRVAKEVDLEIYPFLKLTSQTSGLRKAREALMIPTEKISKILKVTRQSYSRLEKSETSGSIGLNKLKKAAAALDCELIYAVVPKSRKRFCEIIWWQIFYEAAEQIKGRRHMPLARPHLLASRMKRLLESHEFRKSQGWTERLQMSHKPQGD